MGDRWRMVVRRHGGPEVLEREAFDLDEPGPGQALVRVSAAGLNFIDTYQRSGLYPLPLPFTPGSEFAGVVEAVGEGVTHVKPGQRVGALLRTPAAYATHVVTEAALLIALPDAISDEIAAAAILKGLTAWALLEPCAKISAGQSVLIHSAAGGVGSILVPWAKALGAIVIAHAGTPAKADRAKQAGADHALSCPFDSLAERVRERTAGRGVDVVLDGVGAASWTASLACTARRGLIISYGNASGPVPPISPLELTRGGSLFLTRPAVFNYVETPEERAEGSRRLFSMITDGTVPVEIGQRHPLADAAAAHHALESRQTIGSTVLIP